jgi:carbonic anhydrase
MKSLIVLITIFALTTPAFAQHAAAIPEEAKTVSPDTALQWLKNGNTRYIKGHVRKDGQGALDRKRLIKGQHPHTIVVSCSDSRVPPELVFDQALGEIFTVRVAGEALDSSVLASVEYAVEHLGANLVLVMGHTSCGAIKAALAAKDGESSGSPSLDKLVADIKPRITQGGRGVSGDDVAQEAFLNARGVAADLVKRSKILEEKVNSGKLQIHSALYHLDTGAVDFN